MSPRGPRRDLTVPGAILVGSVIIGASLFLGLRSRGTPGAVTAPTQAAAAPQPTALPDKLKQKVAAQAVEALEAQRKDLVTKCWTPAARQSPEPALARYSFNVTFNAEGTEIARGISDVRGFERPEVGQCLRQQPLGLRIPPPGVNVMVDVPFTLP